MTTPSSEHVSERPVARECAWCGTAIELNPRAQHQRFCSRSCRQRAYEVRTATRRAQQDQDAGTARPADEPIREVVERVTVRTVRRTVAAPPHPFSEHPQRVVEVEVPIVPTPTSAREAADFMTVTAACIADGSIKLHDHKRVYQGVRALLHAFDRTHPGGLERLMGGH